MTRTKPKQLNTRQRTFCEVYLTNGFKRDEAAIAAGYSEKRAAQTAHDLLRYPLVIAYIEERMQQLQMSADEALYRLGQHARGDISRLIGLSPDELIRHPQAWLVKKVKVGMHFPERGEPRSYIEALELHDQQAALNTIIKQHQLAAGKPTEIVRMMPTLEQLVDALQAAGKNPQEVFERLLQRVTAEGKNA